MNMDEVICYVIGGFGVYGAPDLLVSKDDDGNADVEVFDLPQEAQNECDELNRETTGGYHVFEVRRIYP